MTYTDNILLLIASILTVIALNKMGEVNERNGHTPDAWGLVLVAPKTIYLYIRGLINNKSSKRDKNGTRST